MYWVPNKNPHFWVKLKCTLTIGCRIGLPRCGVWTFVLLTFRFDGEGARGPVSSLPASVTLALREALCLRRTPYAVRSPTPKRGAANLRRINRDEQGGMLAA